MRKDGRWHFNDGRGPEDDTAVCMSIHAYKYVPESNAHVRRRHRWRALTVLSFPPLHRNFGKLAKENPDTWEEEYDDKSKWVFIAPE